MFHTEHTAPSNQSFHNTTHINEIHLYKTILSRQNDSFLLKKCIKCCKLC